MSFWKIVQERLDKWIAVRTGAEHDAAAYGKNWSTPSDPRWRTYFEYFCESPAETAFMEAMISELGLEPHEGRLVSNAIKLDLQVRIDPYRADFVVNDSLVVEIDGAEFHSTPCAVERDRKRDEYMRRFGYEVLRIPARTVFREPSAAVAAVLGAAPPILPVEKTARQPVVTLMKGFVGKVGKAIEDIDKSMKAIHLSREALRTAKATWDAQKVMVECALEHAETEVQVSAFKAKSAEHAKQYDDAYREFEKLLVEELGEADEEAPDLATRSIQAPTALGDPDIDAQIAREFDNLLAQRKRFFGWVRARLTSNEELRDHFQSFLEEAGCPGLGMEVSAEV